MKVPLFIPPLLTLIGCATQQATEFAFPKEVRGGWALKSSTAMPSESAPAVVRTLGLRKAFKGEYDGPSAVELTVYVMKSQTVAFECFQRWQRVPGTIPFYRNNLFFVPSSTSLDKSSLDNFVRSLEAAL